VTEREIPASVNSQALSAYLQGRYFCNRRAPGDVETAVNLYGEALRLEPRLARAWVGLAAAYAAQAGDGAISNEVGLAKRRHAIDEALMLDRHLAEAHVRAAELAWDTGDIAAATKHHREAVASEPDNPMVLVLTSNAAAWHDRLDEAITLARHVVTLDPLVAVQHGHLANLLLSVGRFEDAKAEFIKQSQLSSTAPPETDPVIGFILILEHRFDEAWATIEHWPAGDDKDQAIAMIGQRVGREAEAAAAMQRLVSSARLSNAVRLAEVHAFRGDSEQAFNALQTAHTRITRDSWSSPDWSWISQLRFSPFLRPLHADPRWPQLRPAKPPLRTVAAR
jgi:tetratricopeptide (TPR) repeat protein